MAGPKRSVTTDARRFFLVVAVLAGALLVLGGVRWWATTEVYDAGIRQGVTFARAVTDSHEAMLDQEAGLRGYQITGDPAYLKPYREGQREYLRSSSLAWRLLPDDRVSGALLAVQERATAWQSEHAVPEIARTAVERQGTAPPRLAEGDRLFEQYREGYEALLMDVRAGNNALMSERERVDRAASLLEVGLAGLALVLAARRRLHTRDDVVRPVQEVTEVLHRLAEGEGSARPATYGTRELDGLASGVRALAEAAQGRRAEAEAARQASAARSRVFERVLAVAHELGSYVDPAELGEALLRATGQVVDLDAAVLRTVEAGELGEALASLPPGQLLPVDDVAVEAVRFLRVAAGADGHQLAVPVVHAGTVHALLQVHASSPLEEDDVLALQNLALAAGGALNAARLHARVHAESRSDALTGLHNRRRFEEDLQHELGLAGRVGVPVSLLLFDVDHFKRFNDTRGHRDGDRLLHDLASLLTLTLRATDSAYRYGGEEFAVLLRGTPADDAARLAERLRARIETRSPVTVSIGVVTAVSDPGPDRVVETADAALYAAKHAGRNQVRRADLAAPLPSLALAQANA